jgi:membrane associated rhomboid family serine protease
MDETVAAPVCYRHPDRPTRLACSECGRPICVECSHDAAVGQKCPEHARVTGRHRVIDARRSTGRSAGLDGAPFVKWTIIATVAIHLIALVSRDARVWLFSNLEHNNLAIGAGEVWRMASHALLHSQASILHIAFNMYALYLFGPTLERQVGTIPFAGMYVGSAAAGSAAAFFLGDAAMIAVGASGAVFGLFGAWLYVSWRMRRSAQGRARFNQLLVLLGINLSLPLFISNIAWQAHVGGLAGGLLIAASWAQWAVGSERPEARRVLLAGLVLAVAVGTVVTLGGDRSCDPLLDTVRTDPTLTRGEFELMRHEAAERYFAALAANRDADALVCVRVANLE